MQHFFLMTLRRWRQVAFWTAALLCAWPVWVPAATVTDLYVGVVRVTDNGATARNEAFGKALGAVLTKVSGRRDAVDKAGAALTDAARYVQRYGYVSGGRLEVGFDRTAVNALLDKLGLPLWGDDRPVTLVMYPVALQGVYEARSITELAAKNRGLPMVWATEPSNAAADAAQLEKLAQRYNADAVLMALGDSAARLTWRMVFKGSSQQSVGAANEGPELAADVLGRYYAVTDQESSSLVLAISGINTVDAYGKTLNYLDRQLLIRNVAILSLQRDVLRVQIDSRGDARALQRALQVDSTLVADGQDTGDGAATIELHYRYNQ